MVCWATTVQVAVPQDADISGCCDTKNFGVPKRVCTQRPALLKDFVTDEQWLPVMAGLDSAATEWGSRRLVLNCFPTQWSSACSSLNAWLANNVPRDGDAATLRWEVVAYTAEAVTSAGKDYTFTAGIALIVRSEDDQTPNPVDGSIDPGTGEVLTPEEIRARLAQRRANYMSAESAAPQAEVMLQAGPPAAAPEQVAVTVNDPVVTKLKQAKELLNAGVLTQEEFDGMKREFINSGNEILSGTSWTW